MVKHINIFFFILFIYFNNSSTKAEAESFQEWLASFKKNALEKGISQKTLDRSFSKVKFIEKKDDQFNIFLKIFAFFIICLISRGLRFFIVAYFSVKFGKPFVSFLEKKGGMWFSVVGILIIIFVLLVYLIFR